MVNNRSRSETCHIRSLGKVLLVSLACMFGCDDDETGPSRALQPPIIFPGIVATADSTSARLQAHIDPRGFLTTYDCEYGTEVDLGNSSMTGDAGNGTGPIGVSVGLAPLVPETQYYYYLRASNEWGKTFTEIDSFTTLRLNHFPDTAISGGPVTGDSNFVGINLNWFGEDSDGYIVRFEWQRVDEGTASVWFSTVVAGSSFVIDAGFIEPWQFSVRAVDNDGAVDPTPATYVLNPVQKSVFIESHR